MPNEPQTDSQVLPALLTELAQQAAILVSVQRTRGSVPREAGAWMAVFADRVLGTVGGGHIEWTAIRQARELLHANARAPDAGVVTLHRFALGPSLGQCCGGEVHLAFEPVHAGLVPVLAERLRIARQPVALFGGGHVGSALVTLLATLPFAVSWIDSREQIFPAHLPDHVSCEHSDPVQQAVPGLASGSRVLIMSFSHAEDLDIVAACLLRQRQHNDLDYIGLIGSRSKWATFSRRLRARGFSDAELATVTCPIGVPGVYSKEPAAIAVAVAAQLLMVRAPCPEPQG